MFMKKLSRNIPYQIGIRRAPYGSDKFNEIQYIEIRIHRTIYHQRRPIIIGELDNKINAITQNSRKNFYVINFCNIVIIVSVRAEYCLSLFLIWIFPPKSIVRSNQKEDCCVISRVQVEFTVKSLHVGTLVTYWTTAPSIIPLVRSKKAQLAPLLLLFFTLTIASRSNASSSNAKQIQLESSPPSTFNHHHPLRNSRIHSSSIVLSRLIQTHFVHKINTSPLRTIIVRTIGRTKRELSKNIYNSNNHNFIPKINSKRVFPHYEEVDTKIYSNKFFGRHSGDKIGTSINRNHENGANISDVVSVSGNFSRVISQKLNYSSYEAESLDKQQQLSPEKSVVRPMPPLNGHNDNSSVDKWSVLSIVISSVTLTLTLGLITCILSHYRTGAAPEGGGTASDQNNAGLAPTSAPMLSVVSAGATAGVGGMERLRGGRTAARDLAAARERQVRLHALRTDLAVNLPPSITLPDGEDHPYSNPRIHIRDQEQEAEIYQKCIRPPPNRTVLESESPPPYRSSSAGLLGSSSSSSSSVDWSTSGGGNAPLVVRCHSMSSSTNKRPDAGTSGQKTDFLQRTVKIFTGKKTTTTNLQSPNPAPTLPSVVVPSGSRRRPPEQNLTPSTHRPSKGGV